MNKNGCAICATPILENINNPDFRIELTGRRALQNYREAFLLVGFPDKSHSKLKIGLCSSCKDSVSSSPPKFYKQIMDNVRQMWVEEMKELNFSIEKVVNYAKYMFSIEVYGYLDGEKKS